LQKGKFSKHENEISLISIVPKETFTQIISSSLDKKTYLWDFELCEDLLEFKNMSAPVSGIIYNGN